MEQYIDVTGKTEEEAIEKALRQLQMDRDDISVTILERARSGFLGIGASPALVRISYDDGKPEPKAAEPQEENSVFVPEKRKSREEREREEAEARAEKERKAAEARSRVPELPRDFTPEVLQNRPEKKTGKKQEKDAAKKSATEKKHEAEKKHEPKHENRHTLPAEEVHDEKSEKIRAFLTGLLAHMESEATVHVYEAAEKNRYRVVLEGEKLGALIGRRGETLDAIQQLTSYAVNRSGDKNRARIQVDAENYREKREQSLTRLAEKVAAKVVKQRRNINLEPMNAYERHVIHTALQDVKDVSTFSIGTEPNRRVVVAYDRNKQMQKSGQ